MDIYVERRLLREIEKVVFSSETRIDNHLLRLIAIQQRLIESLAKGADAAGD